MELNPGQALLRSPPAMRPLARHRLHPFAATALALSSFLAVPRSPAQALATLHLQAAPGQTRVVAGNALAGPVQVRIFATSRPGFTAVPALPAEAVLPARGQRVIAHLYAGADTDGAVAATGLGLEAVPGDPRARAEDVAYRLPFDADAGIRVDQAWDGRFSHRDAENRYAVDFALATGTPVLAARRGTVMQVVDGVTGNRRAPGPDGVPANLVRVLHEDGTMAVYAHLAPGGMRVRPGEVVAAGQVLGLSGDSGLSTAPHLHFAVQANRGMRLVSLPFRMVVAAGELHFPRGD